ncbi:hypothetical protein SAMN05421754_11073 [Nitrosomonas sp. Nm58]|nr:hypothetical protein SAMN05421754_11073 [Nitrosomonas sp. Nm58]
MLAAAIEAEVFIFIERHGSLKTDEGKAAVVRNGYLPERSIQTGLEILKSKFRRLGIAADWPSSLTVTWYRLT